MQIFNGPSIFTSELSMSDNNPNGNFFQILTGDYQIPDAPLNTYPTRTFLLEPTDPSVISLPANPRVGEKLIFISNVKLIGPVINKAGKALAGFLNLIDSGTGACLPTYIEQTSAALETADNSKIGQYVGLMATDSTHFVLLDNMGWKAIP